MQVLTPRSSRWRCRRPRHSCWIASYALLGGAACCWTLTQASLLRKFPTRCSVVRACCLYSSVRPSVCLCCAPRVLVLVRIVCRRALVLVLRSLCARAVLVPCLCCGVLVFCVRGCVVPRVLARVCLGRCAFGMPASAASAVSFKTAAVVGTAAFVAIHTRKNHPHLGVSVHGAAGGKGMSARASRIDRTDLATRQNIACVACM